MENNFDYRNCNVNGLKSRCKEFVLREFYSCIYANNLECVKYLLDNYSWLSDILQPSWIADMQFYDFDEQKYKTYFPSEELLELLKSYTNIIEPITKSAGNIDDNASYISNTMQNKNTINWECNGEDLNGQKLTLVELAKKAGKTENYIRHIESINGTGISKSQDIELEAMHLKRLGQMGNSWFVSYMYHYYDKNHRNWEITLNNFRTGYFKDTKKVHYQFLERISKANEAALGRNQIGLSGAEIRRMAKELLTHWDVVSQNPDYKKEIGS